MSTMAEKIQWLAAKIPGYTGYAEKEARRAADKELRDATAAAFNSQVTRITRVQEQMINAGDFERPTLLDAIIGRLQHLADRIRTASYGFGSFFDDNVVDEVVLDRLYAFDLELANGVEQVADLIAQLSDRSRQDEIIQRLRDKIDQLHETFGQRNHLINTFPSPLASSSDSTTVETPVTEE